MVASRLAAFYVLTAVLLGGAVLAHEYAHHFAAHGWTSVQLETAPTRVHGEMLAMQARESATDGSSAMIVLYPNLLRFAATLGLTPAGAYPDDGVLAETFLDLPEAHEVGVPPVVQAAPAVLAVAGLLAGLAWLVGTRSLGARALTWAYYCELGNNVHHFQAMHLSPMPVLGTASALVVAAAVLAVLQSQPARRLARPPASRRPARPGTPAAAGAAPAAARAARPATPAWLATIVPPGTRAPSRVREPHEIAWRPARLSPP
ncbi:MAG TPA: hypothetical protein VFH47_06905 [Candidatus Thermoplasmatota archaeon]|nr:hypothetical protein [Candidatus Thermoplasmatota archaeon]